MAETLSIRDIIILLLKKWWLIVVLTMVSTALGYGLSLGQTPIYEAITILTVGQVLTEADSNIHQENMSQMIALTHADLARRQRVLQPVAEQLNLPGGWQQLKAQVHSRPIYATRQFEVTVQAPTEEDAIRLADAIASELVRQSPRIHTGQFGTVQKTLIEERLADLQQRIENSQDETADLQAQQKAASSPQDAQYYENQWKQIQGSIGRWQQLQARLDAILRPTYLSNVLSVAEVAQSNTSLLFPRLRVNMIVAALLGTSLGAGLIFVLAHFKSQVSSVDILTEQFSIHHLGSVGQMPVQQDLPTLIHTPDINTPLVKAYHSVQKNVCDVLTGPFPHVLMVTSVNSGEGKSVTAANVSLAMAQAGLKTVLVDISLRRPMLHYFFQTPAQGGLATLLNDPDLAVADQLTQTKNDHLRLLLTEPLPAPPKFIAQSRLSDIFAELSKEAEIIILDAPAILSGDDVALWAKYVDSVVLVIEAEKTTQVALQQAKSRLKQANLTILGSILNRASPNM
ncbi:MAG: polysaccharide biosynthesis tyrosine autokinase [Chloroflexota bacterium]